MKNYTIILKLYYNTFFMRILIYKRERKKYINGFWCSYFRVTEESLEKTHLSLSLSQCLSYSSWYFLMYL